MTVSVGRLRRLEKKANLKYLVLQDYGMGYGRRCHQLPYLMIPYDDSDRRIQLVPP